MPTPTHSGASEKQSVPPRRHPGRPRGLGRPPTSSKHLISPTSPVHTLDSSALPISALSAVGSAVADNISAYRQLHNESMQQFYALRTDMAAFLDNFSKLWTKWWWRPTVGTSDAVEKNSHVERSFLNVYKFLKVFPTDQLFSK